MVDKVLNIDTDSFWAEIEADYAADMPPSAEDGWFNIRDLAERLGVEYRDAKNYLMRNIHKYEQRKYKDKWVYYRLIKDD